MEETASSSRGPMPSSRLRQSLCDVERRERGGAARAAFLERHAPEVATAPLVDLYHRMVARG